LQNLQEVQSLQILCFQLCAESAQSSGEATSETGTKCKVDEKNRKTVRVTFRMDSALANALKSLYNGDIIDEGILL
jgi:hypothetical protein